jgi:hypothetical protein
MGSLVHSGKLTCRCTAYDVGGEGGNALDVRGVTLTAESAIHEAEQRLHPYQVYNIYRYA